MKNLIRYLTGVVSLAAVFALPVLAAQPGCNGNWQVMLHSDSALEASRQANGVWIPATISLDRQLAACGKGISFRQAAGGPLQLTAGVSSQAYELANGSRQKLKNKGKDQYWMPLNGKQQVDFWLYLPRGQHMLPGLYQSIVDIQLMPANHDKPLQKVHTFSYLVKPYVRVKLNKKGGNWLPSSGTTVGLDLGDLTKVNKVKLPVYVDSNGFVTMSVKSEHQGKLTLAKDPQQQIPYEFKLRGRSIPLMDQAIIDIGHKVGQEQRVELSFKNQAAPFAKAGTYEDIITISMWAR